MTDSALNLVIGFVARWHSGRRSIDGTPLILHVMRIILKQTDPECQIIAALYDALTDGQQINDLFGMGFFAGQDWADESTTQTVKEALIVLYRGDSTARDYLAQVKSCPHAIPVLIADLMDQLNMIAGIPVRDGHLIDLEEGYRWMLGELLKLSQPPAPPKSGELVQITLPAKSAKSAK